MKIVDIYPGMVLPKNPQDEIEEQQFLKENPVWISDIHYKAWQERLERMPPEDRKKWLEGEWKPLECEHSVLNVPKIT